VGAAQGYLLGRPATVPDQRSVDLADLEAGTRFVSSESDGPGIVEFQKRLAMRRAAS
jgi:hypothetical protein